MVKFPVYVPKPVPFDVLKWDIVGLGEVFQQIPRAVIVALPSEVTLPVQLAVVSVMFVTLPVVTVGIAN